MRTNYFYRSLNIVDYLQSKKKHNLKDKAGWAALSSVSTRKVYAVIAEVSVYDSNKYRGCGVGYKLLERMITESEKENFWTLQAGIFPENHASLQIHKKLNFREIGYRERIGKMNGIWRNTVLLERRSDIVGVV